MTGTKVPSSHRPEHQGRITRPQRDRAAADAEGGGARLDEATNSPPGPWVTTLYPAAGEASVVFYRPPAEPVRYVQPGEGADPERSAREAARRAATTLRRFCAHHCCDRLWSLTYRCRRCRRPEGCVCEEGPDRPTDEHLDDVWRDIERMRERFREWAGEDVALAVVIEHHGDGVLHVHGATNRYVPREVMAQLWPHGFADPRRFRSPWTRDLGKRARARMVASYMASYLKKDFIEGHIASRHRYSTSRNMAPSFRQLRAHSRGDARAWCCILMRSEPDSVWSSDQLEHWDGPPVELAYWDGDP